jgi:hypothetical protein
MDTHNIHMGVHRMHTHTHTYTTTRGAGHIDYANKCILLYLSQTHAHDTHT